MAHNASLNSLIRVKFSSADLSTALYRMAVLRIPIEHVTYENDLTVVFSVYPRDLTSLRKMAAAHGEELEILSQWGIRYALQGLLNRKILILGIVCILLVTWALPRRVLFLHVEGNSIVPTRSILDAAQQSGVVFGASRKDVRSERVKNAMLQLIPSLQWVGINTYGCVAVISVRERAGEEPANKESDFGHVVAIRDGVIMSCNATRGNLICSPGQAVTQGEILISGYTDCGLVIRAEQAQGEIYGMTKHLLTVKSSLARKKQVPTGGVKKKISLLVGKKRINLWKDSGIYDMVCDRMYSEYYVTLPGGFVLPLALCVDRYVAGALEEAPVSAEEMQQFLRESTRNYLKTQMVGGTIRQESHKIQTTENTMLLAGEYVCVELIGKMQREKIGEINGQTD